MTVIIKIEVIYDGNSYFLQTTKHAYANLMVLLLNELTDEDFGDCKGMGKCGTCLIEILEGNDDLERQDRNEETTLSKMKINQSNIRLACQLLVDESLMGIKIRVI
ncbi:MAG: 2Fe-2S iron-sulfur cluster binding domain-containing protein [Bacteroidetes bacterium]|nr:2Fe-2S iron-sulfur cluster binding domain-containing protein [Bacteroidota bacterium]MBU1373289.1 2Fe-2S iron-sulfur cluster binding domain-containing protein [Bacteroidota bacterium]MBU1484219.1 2Fe-2S iron-sulfur cluster binding domain-containing protein [Bacteroidota bacterium]MBU1760527.1 2Fe-2S iron-sulfur cluster binding domain-containing protein [Bacteroidota bacterium]MBU2268363.1 2Fe-2S iron-sulfur cluster binding domain-containing protein [Bacteroidota bacterium]